MYFSTESLSTSSVSAWRTAGSRQRRMLGLEARALAVDLGPRIGGVELDVLDVAAGRDVDLALAALLQALKDLVLDLHVPGEVVFAGLQHRARRRHRVAAALHLDRCRSTAGCPCGSSG